MLKAIFFDLDGTLLRIDETKFANLYFDLLGKKLMKYGYDPKVLEKALYQGTYLMMKNDGKKTNEEVFWDFFRTIYPDCDKDHEVFDSFYREEFKSLETIIEKEPLSKEIVHYTKNKGLLPVLSTNPIFPMEGQKTRISLLGLTPTDFSYITSYENSSFAKPNPMYFKSLLDRFSLKSDEVIVIGNNDFEDGDCATALGLKVYLVEGYLIHSSHAKGKYETISLKDVISVIDREVEKRKKSD